MELARETRSVNFTAPAGNGRAMIATIVAISAAAWVFLFWLVYFHRAPASFAHRLGFLPALNAGFNGMSAIALVTGYFFIRGRRITAHRNSMLAAFGFSTLFLASYIANHALHGDQLFAGRGAIRVVYLSILGSHILLTVVALPLVLVTFFFSLSGRFPQHRRVARWTFPLWLYVSVTGVVVGVMLMVWK
jgi:putative membrane protein